jgi:AraC-like DNA-binding protein
LPKVKPMLDIARHNPTAASTLAARASASDVIPFVAATAWIKAATHCRFNIDPLFEAAGVALNASNVAMIRKCSLLKLMQECVDQAAPNFHFPLVLGEMFAFDFLPAMETFLATSPTLRHALPALHWAGLTMPNLSLRVEEHGLESALLLDVDASAADPRVRGYFVEAILAGISKIVRLALGNTSLIHDIQVKHQPDARFMTLTAGFPAPIRGGQTRDAAIFATRLLDMPLPGASPSLHRRAQELVQQQLPDENDDVVTQLERTFRQSPALLGQGLDRVADRLTIHPRTLQRRLKEAGQQFTDIQARMRLDIAKTALSARQCDMETLSADLGFADRHSFTRAFKRWTGLSPSAFKRQQHASGTGEST